MNVRRCGCVTITVGVILNNLIKINYQLYILNSSYPSLVRPSATCKEKVDTSDCLGQA